MSTYSNGKGSYYNDNYNERVQKLFERVGNLQSAVDDQKSSRIKEIETILLELEKKLNDIRINKGENIKDYDKKVISLLKQIKQIQLALEEERDSRLKLETELNTEIHALEKNCQKIIEDASKDRQIHDGKLISKMNSHVENIQNEIQKNLEAINEASPDFEFVINEEIPKLQRDLTNEVNLRRELENKILEQFMDQIGQLNESFQDEKRERELREEEIVSSLKNISSEIEGMIGQQRMDRERNEEMILNLIEQVIERLRQDAADNDI